MAGYSGKPLAQKLGIKPGAAVRLVNVPVAFAGLEGLPIGVTFEANPSGRFEVILLFNRDRSELEAAFAAERAHLTPTGGLWVAWPKKASGVLTDLTEDVVRNIGLNAGLVDNKVCAVDETWSGLRFVYRLTDRAK